MSNQYLKYLLLICLLFLSGCQSFRDNLALKAGYTNKTKADGILEQTKKEYEGKLADKDKDIQIKQTDFVKGLQSNAQFSADRLYGASLGYLFNQNKDRNAKVVNDRVEEARTTLPPPTVAAMAKENEQIVKDLDEARTSLADLQKSHDAKIIEANQLTKDVADKAAALEKAKQDKIAIEADEKVKLDAAQTKVNQANDTIITGEKARANDAVAIQATKTKLSLGAGALAALCIAGAIWSPVMKDKFAIAAAILGVAAVGIWYLTPLVVLIIVGVSAAALTAWAVFNHNKESKAAIATYSALQEIKAKSSDVWDKNIAPVLESWQTKYITHAGTVTEVPDPTIAAHIDQKLAETNQK